MSSSQFIYMHNFIHPNEAFSTTRWLKIYVRGLILLDLLTREIIHYSKQSFIAYKGPSWTHLVIFQNRCSRSIRIFSTYWLLSIANLPDFLIRTVNANTEWFVKTFQGTKLHRFLLNCVFYWWQIVLCRMNSLSV